MPATVKASDLAPEVRKQLGLRRPKKDGLSKEKVRRLAIEVLAELGPLTQRERKRVLEHALKVNQV